MFREYVEEWSLAQIPPQCAARSSVVPQFRSPGPTVVPNSSTYFSYQQTRWLAAADA